MRPLTLLRTIAAALLLVAAAVGCSGEGDASRAGERVARVDTATICEAASLRSAIQLADAEGTLAGMAGDPVVQAAANNPVLTRLVDALNSAELADTLDSAEALTIFAPTDCAFAGLDQATLDSALADPSGLLTRVLGFHVIPGQRLSAADLAGEPLETFTGQALSYVDDGGSILLDGQARIVVPDIQTGNATVHLIDAVMVPGNANGTVEEPTPAAAAPTVPDGSGGTCTTDELMAAVESGPEQGTLAGMADDPVAVAASNNPVLRTLVEAVVQASLVDTLNSAEALTVFAPTDCAFAQLDPDTLATAMADPNGLLAQILGFHVVVGERLTFDQLSGGELATFNGAPLPYTNEGNVVTLNGQARIVLPNIQTANATVHLIDTVMIPPVE